MSRGGARSGGFAEEMHRESDNQSSIVVLESGAGFPSWIAECQRTTPNSIVIAQSIDAGVTGFVTRALTRIDDFTRSSCELRVAVVVCNAELASEQLAARYRICQRLLAALDRSRPSELVLAIGDGPEASRHALMSLAGDLCEAVSGSTINVRVRFFGDRHVSGTMPAVLPQPVADVAGLRR